MNLLYNNNFHNQPANILLSFQFPKNQSLPPHFFPKIQPPNARRSTTLHHTAPHRTIPYQTIPYHTIPRYTTLHHTEIAIHLHPPYSAATFHSDFHCHIPTQSSASIRHRLLLPRHLPHPSQSTTRPQNPPISWTNRITNHHSSTKTELVKGSEVPPGPILSLTQCAGSGLQQKPRELVPQKPLQGRFRH